MCVRIVWSSSRHRVIIVSSSSRHRFVIESFFVHAFDYGIENGELCTICRETVPGGCRRIEKVFDIRFFLQRMKSHCPDDHQGRCRRLKEFIKLTFRFADAIRGLSCTISPLSQTIAARNFSSADSRCGLLARTPFDGAVQPSVAIDAVQPIAANRIDLVAVNALDIPVRAMEAR